MWQNRFLFSLQSSLLQQSLHSGGLQLPLPRLELKRYFRPLWGGSIRLGHLFRPPTPNDLYIPTLLHRSSGSRFSSDIFFAFSYLALSCSWEVLQHLGSDHLPILLSVPLSPVFCPNKRRISFNFLKARWNDFASYFGCHCSFAEEYSFLSLSSAAAFFTSLALNVAKSSILDKVAYPMLKYLPRSGIDFLLHIFNLSWTLHSFPSIWKVFFIIPIHKMGKASQLSCFLPAYPSHVLCIKAF